MTTRYTFGGDEHIFVECSEEMSLEAFFKGMSITTIAYKWGFTDSAHFSRSFQKQFERSPKDYRSHSLAGPA